MVSPVKSAFAGKEYRGMLVVTRDINMLNMVFDDRSNLGQTGESYMVSRGNNAQPFKVCERDTGPR